MRENFESWTTNLAEWEGFRSNDHDDPGGDTVFGIARAFYPDLTPWPPTWEQAKLIYLNDYWIKNGCDKLPFPLDVIHADSCVNPGPGAAKKFMYSSSEHPRVDRKCVEYLTLRLRYYLLKVKENPAKLKFLAGWMDRTLDMIERSIIASWDAEYM
jgi:hypothetical protein